MELLSARKKPCLLRLRMNCPFRKIRRQTYAVSTAASSAVGLYWNNVSLNASNQPINTAGSQSLPPLTSDYGQSDEVSADVHMEENRPDTENERKQQNQKIPENRAENCMEMDDCVDPETGESALG